MARGEGNNEMKNQRVIKFRAWDGFNKRMIPQYVWFEQRDGHIAENIQKPATSRITAVMQCTGSMDRNGNEIFEGDIVEWRSTHNGSRKSSRVDIVTWEDDAFLLMPWVHELKYADMEILGNIFENPELNLRVGDVII